MLDSDDQIQLMMTRRPA